MSEPVSERVVRADALRNRQRIVAATLACFAEGKDRTNMVDIARAAGVGVGSLYRGFGSRSKLIEVVYRDALAALVAEADELAQAAEPKTALRSWLSSYITSYRAKRAMLRDLSAVFANDPELLTSSREQARTALEAVLHAAQQAGVVRPDVVATDVLSLAHGVVGQELSENRDELMLDLIMRGLDASAGSDSVQAH